MKAHDERHPSLLEEIVLYAVLDVADENAYTFALIDRINQTTGRTISPGALYTVLARLEDKGYVESKIGEATPNRGGRPRRLYWVNAVGMQTMAEIERGRRDRVNVLKRRGLILDGET